MKAAILVKSKEQSVVKDKLDALLSSMPNLPLEDVPVGKDESFNKELLKSGKIKEFTSATINLIKNPAKIIKFICSFFISNITYFIFSIIHSWNM